MGKVKVNTLKVKREAELEEEAVKFKMSWPGQMRFILSRRLDQRTSRASATVWLHHSQSHLYHSKEKADFLNFRADRKVLGHDVSGPLPEVIDPYFICVVSSPTVTCCWVFMLHLCHGSGTGQKKSQTCRTVSIWSTVGSFYCIIKESNMLLS